MPLGRGSAWLRAVDRHRCGIPPTGFFPGPQSKPLAQKPKRKAAVLGWKCKYTTIFYGTRRHTCSNPQPGGPGDCVRLTSTHGPTWYERICGYHAGTLQYSSMGRRGTQTATPRFWRALSIFSHIRKCEHTKNLLCSQTSEAFLDGQACQGEQIVQPS
ncbi:hypothetical protein CSKR_107252 [Clonorchis sinensis]|uniref:Uncharacterized protein n=1 Tax=Clonorchis sinensis TaxID=79923 RepID=A0A419PRK9_CLOSI|nr:hypothetical protein CSKR_107252 [Clonorchis sinensis]